MATRLYLIPAIGTGTDKDARRPKYFTDGTVTVIGELNVMDYGAEPWFIVSADLSPAHEATVIAQPDASAVPADMNTFLTAGQVTAVQNRLELMNIPTLWVNTSLTWIEVVRIVLGMFVFMQRFTAIHGGPVFLGGVTLNTTVSQLSVGVRNELTTAATSLGLAIDGITLASTIRAVLKVLADQLRVRPVSLGSVSV